MKSYLIYCIVLFSALLDLASAQTYTYDALGRLTSSTNSGRKVTYAYDAVGNITSLTTSASVSIRPAASPRRLADGTVEQRFEAIISDAKQFEITVSGHPEGKRIPNANLAPGNSERKRSEAVRVNDPQPLTFRFSNITGDLAEFRPRLLLRETASSGSTELLALREVEFEAGQCRRLVFTSVPGKSYAVEYSDDLSTWHRTSEPFKADTDRSVWENQLHTKTAPIGDPNNPRHYRVVQQG